MLEIVYKDNIKNWELIVVDWEFKSEKEKEYNERGL